MQNGSTPFLVGTTVGTQSVIKVTVTCASWAPFGQPTGTDFGIRGNTSVCSVDKSVTVNFGESNLPDLKLNLTTDLFHSGSE